MYDIRKKTVEKRNSRGDIVKKVVTLTKKFHNSTKPKGKNSHGSTKPKGKNQQRPPSDHHLQPNKYPLLPPPNKFPLAPPPSTMFPRNMHHPLVQGNRGEIYQRQEYGLQNYNSSQSSSSHSLNNQGYDKFVGQPDNQGYGTYNSQSFKGQDNEEYGLQNLSRQSFSQSSNNQGSDKAAFGMPKANVTKYSEAAASDAESSDAKESEAENIISSEESEAESEAEDTNSEESETESEAETEVETETEIESEAENTNSEESEAEDSDDEPPRRGMNINGAMRNLSMQRQDGRNYNFW